MFRTAFATAALVVAASCATPTVDEAAPAASWDALTSEAAPAGPPGLFIEAPLDLPANEFAKVLTHGGLASEKIFLMASASGIGPGPCPSAFGGACLDIMSPIKLVGTDITDLSGDAFFGFNVPDRAGLELCFQAVAQRGPGGIDSEFSEVVCGEIYKKLNYYYTCGDPVCSGYDGPFPGIPLCAGEVPGDTCPSEGELCDPGDFCNALIVCTDVDPHSLPGGCPISRKRHKNSIHYLSNDEVDKARKDVMDIKLAKWRYNGADAADPLRMGFMIDDMPESPAVLPNGEQVDVYGYTSLAVAAVQSQDREIEALRAELQAMQQKLEAMQQCDSAGAAE